MTNEVQGEAGDARGGRCGAVLDWHDGEPICCEAREGTWHWEGHSLKSPAGEYFDYDAHGFKVYVAEQLNAYHATAALAVEALREIGRCTRCKGDGSPQCVSCDDYQACRCRPGEGRYAEKCWCCEGTGIGTRQVRDALARIEAARGEATR